MILRLIVVLLRCGAFDLLHKLKHCSSARVDMHWYNCFFRSYTAASMQLSSFKFVLVQPVFERVEWHCLCPFSND